MICWNKISGKIGHFFTNLSTGSRCNLCCYHFTNYLFNESVKYRFLYLLVFILTFILIFVNIIISWSFAWTQINIICNNCFSFPVSSRWFDCWSIGRCLYCATFYGGIKQAFIGNCRVNCGCVTPSCHKIFFIRGCFVASLIWLFLFFRF